MRTLPLSDSPSHGESQLFQLEWSALHVRDHRLPVQSWQQVRELIGNVGTTEWPWLLVQTTPIAHRRRRATCTGFADILSVDVCDWDDEGRMRRVRRLGFGPLDDRWADVGASIDRCPRVRRSQVLSPQTAALAFHDWLELGQVDGFTCEAI